MTAPEILGRITGALERAGIPYMLTGSFASSYHGAPRATQDIDIVIAASDEQIRILIRSLPASEYYADEKTALDAQRRHGQFNVIDLATGWKVDLIMQKPRPFSREEFARKTPVDFQGTQLVIASAEDVLIAKLEWAKRSESKRQIEDAAGILRIRAGNLDRGYVLKWVRQLGLLDEWDVASRLAGMDE